MLSKLVAQMYFTITSARFATIRAYTSPNPSPTTSTGSKTPLIYWSASVRHLYLVSLLGIRSMREAIDKLYVSLQGKPISEEEIKKVKHTFCFT